MSVQHRSPSPVTAPARQPAAGGGDPRRGGRSSRSPWSSALVAVVLPPTSTPAPLPGPPHVRPIRRRGTVVAGIWPRETELATRPMTPLPEGAALPQPLERRRRRRVRRCGCPRPPAATGPVPRGFPPTPEGALAQLVALTGRGTGQRRPAGLRGRLHRGRRRGRTCGRGDPAARRPGGDPGPRGPARDRRGSRADLRLDPGRRTDQGQHRPRPLRGGLCDRAARLRRQRADPVHRGRGLPGAALRRRASGGSAPARPPRPPPPAWPGSSRGRPGRLPGGDPCCVTPSPTRSTRRSAE